MRKTTIMGAIALTALTVMSCSNDEELFNANNNEHQVIGFDAYTARPGQPARGINTDITSMQTSGFGVLAYHTATDWTTNGTTTAPAFMYNTKVSTSAWTYDNPKLWPADASKISFFAYAPYNGEGISLSGQEAQGAPQLTYTLPAGTPAKMIDIVTATTLNQTKNTNAGKAAFAFNHILSRVGFKVKADAEYADAKINITAMGLTVAEGSGLHSGATYTWGTNGNTAANNNQDGKWTTYTTPLAGSSLVLPGTLNAIDNSGTTTGYTTNGHLLTTTGTNPLKAEGEGADTYWYLIPPTSGNITGTTFTFNFTYDIVTNNKGTWSKRETVEKSLTLPKSVAMVAGKAYTFTFTFAVGADDVIKFDVTSVDDWGTDINQDVTVQ